MFNEMDYLFESNNHITSPEVFYYLEASPISGATIRLIKSVLKEISVKNISGSIKRLTTAANRYKRIAKEGPKSLLAKRNALYMKANKIKDPAARKQINMQINELDKKIGEIKREAGARAEKYITIAKQLLENQKEVAKKAQESIVKVSRHSVVNVKQMEKLAATGEKINQGFLNQFQRIILGLEAKLKNIRNEAINMTKMNAKKIKADVGNLKQTANKMKSDVNEIKSQVAKNKQDINGAYKYVKSYTDFKIEPLQKRLGALQNNFIKLSDKIWNEIDSLKMSISGSKSAIKSMKANINKLANKLDNVFKGLLAIGTGSAVSTAVLTSKINKQQKQLESLKTEINTMKKQNNFSKLRQEIAKIKKQIAMAMNISFISSLKNNLDALKSETVKRLRILLPYVHDKKTAAAIAAGFSVAFAAMVKYGIFAKIRMFISNVITKLINGVKIVVQKIVGTVKMILRPILG